MAFTDGLCALCGGEPAWRLDLGEWTCKCIPLFITVAIVSRFPDGFADGLCCGEPPWRFVLGEWVNMQIYFSFHYCSYCVPMSWWLYWRVGRSVRWRTSVEWRLVLGEWTCKSIPLFVTVAIVSRFPDGFADGLCGVEPLWRFILGEWTWKSFSLFITVAIVSWWLYWRVVRSVRWRTSVETCSRWMNMQMYSSFHYCSYCVPISWRLCWRAVRSVRWKSRVELCSRWVNMAIFFSLHYCSYCVQMSWYLYWRVGRSVRWRTSVETCSRWVNMQMYSLFITVAIVSRFPDGFADRLCCGEPPWRFVLGEWVNMQIYFSFHYCSYCVPMSWWLLLTGCALCAVENQRGDLF